MIGTASVCRGISLYLDTLINDTLKTTFAEVAPMNISFLGSYFDFFACGLVVVFGGNIDLINNRKLFHFKLLNSS